MSQVKELRAKLKKLHGLQWTKKQQLKNVVKFHGECQRRISTESSTQVPGQGRLEYVPLYAVKSMMYYNKTISKLSKDLNARAREIRIAESYLRQILDYRSRDAYFQDTDGSIVGVHAGGYEGPNGEFYQDDIWANNYEKDKDGLLVMKGGSMRVFGAFNEVVEEFSKDFKLTKLDGKLKHRDSSK
jgi:hypothetical protein